MYVKFSNNVEAEQRGSYLNVEGIKWVMSRSWHFRIRTRRFVVYYARAKQGFGSRLRKERRLWVVEGLTLERCSTFGKKYKLDPSYVEPFEILGWIGPIVRLRLTRLLFCQGIVEFVDREVKSLKRSKIALVKVRWESKRGPVEFTEESLEGFYED
ncbi:hypothetical protein Tco_1156302 [Tanacetum coccineum]